MWQASASSCTRSDARRIVMSRAFEVPFFAGQEFSDFTQRHDIRWLIGLQLLEMVREQVHPAS